MWRKILKIFETKTGPVSTAQTAFLWYRPPTPRTSDRQRRINPAPQTLAAVPIKAHELTGRRRRRRQRGGRNRNRAMGSDTEAEKKRAPVALAPIAKPLAGKKLCKRTLKLVRRGLEDCYTPPFAVAFMMISPCLYTIISILFAASEAKCLKRGVKEVVKSIRRGNKGFVIYTALLCSCIACSSIRSLIVTSS
jgi:hypothetical protein